MLLRLQVDANVAPACTAQVGRVGHLCSNHVQVYVDDTLVFGGNTSGARKIALGGTLGWLNASQTIYVGYGPGTSDGADSFNTDFTIVRGVVPAINAVANSRVGLNDAYTWSGPFASSCRSARRPAPRHLSCCPAPGW